MNAPANITELKNPPPREASMPAVRAGFFDLQSFELIQRVSKAFAQSDLVPKQYQGNLANCMIAMDMAQRIGANPLMVMQNLYIVHGTPGWSSKFLIATINVCGRYTSLRYEWRGKPGEAEYGCRAWAIEKETNERLDGIWVDWKMVKAEGWDSKNGSKWKTMADQMFVYRAAAFWQRAYAPELGMGLQTVEDLQDTFDATKDATGAYSVDLDELAIRGNEATRPGASESAAPKEGEIIDVAAGEIIESGASAPAGDSKSTGTGPTYEDAISAIQAGDYDMARDIARGFTEEQQKSIEAAIANQKGGAQRQRRGRGQDGFGLE